MHMLRGAVLAACVLALACNTEPDALQGGDPDHIVSDPEVMYIPLGGTEQVLLRLVDQQGTSMETEFAVTAGAATVAVTADPLFRPVYAPDGTLQANTNNLEIRVLVTAAALGATTVTATAEGMTQSIAVTVTPVQMTPTVSNAAPSILEPVTIAPEAGLTFTALSGVVDAVGVPAAYTIAVAPDGSSMTVLFKPAASGAFSITHVVPAYAPTLSLTVPSTVEVATTAVVGTELAGTDAIATAPVLQELNSGSFSGIVDAGNTYGYLGEARIYKLVVTEEGEYDFALNYSSGDDLAIMLYDEAGVEIETVADDGGDDTDELAEAHVVEVGTYYVGVLSFGGPPTPAYELSITPSE